MPPTIISRKASNWVDIPITMRRLSQHGLLFLLSISGAALLRAHTSPIDARLLGGPTARVDTRKA